MSGFTLQSLHFIYKTAIYNRILMVFLDGPHNVVLSPSIQSYIVTETTGSVGPISCTSECRPNCTLAWSGPNLSDGAISIMYLQNINRKQAGEYRCTASNAIKNLASDTITVIVYCKLLNCCDKNLN